MTEAISGHSGHGGSCDRGAEFLKKLAEVVALVAMSADEVIALAEWHEYQANVHDEHGNGQERDQHEKRAMQLRTILTTLTHKATP